MSIIGKDQLDTGGQLSNVLGRNWSSGEFRTPRCDLRLCLFILRCWRGRAGVLHSCDESIVFAECCVLCGSFGRLWSLGLLGFLDALEPERAWNKHGR